MAAADKSDVRPLGYTSLPVRLLPALCAVVCLVSFGAAAAPPASTRSLDKAEAAFDELEYDHAAALYEQALKEPGSRADRLTAYKGLSLSFAFIGAERDAKEAFRRWLSLDPTAKVESRLGPKVTKPHAAAKKAVEGKKARLELTQDLSTGTLTVQLYESLPMSSDVAIAWRAVGNKDFKIEKGGVEAPFTVKPPPTKDVEVFAFSLDPDNGVLHEEGTREKPVKFSAVKKASPTVARKGPVEVTSAPEEAFIPEPEESSVSSGGGSSNWPIWVGVGVGVVGAGVAGVMLSRPPGLALPAADRTVALP